ncbi:ARM repeat-containing protein [Coniophora puteana RWD-64-598 SS2]|uniref:ARM repeat-containing protein n=1 Tax=Coniophora puteana (strain RWD-64-598) TaxID=741705 RepID=A0A5M3N7X9_CONPW|nr:ARM repeat-containing protein [Coniophora puteana RWD-64-598 SS2]EIW87416.1 ARM repeat-containing protein [Coniophora puteana RWD-64-598 SS2]
MSALVANLRRKDIGAIGDGRRAGHEGFEHNHVEQLLRALNLSSPGPFAGQRSQHVNLDAFTGHSGTPDVSPCSTTSTLLTPADLSPAKSFDPKLSLNDMHPHNLNFAPSSLLFDPPSPMGAHDLRSSPQSAMQRFDGGPSPNTGFPFVDQLTDNVSMHASSQPFYESSFPPSTRGSELPRMPSTTWRHQQLSAPDWARAEEKFGTDTSGLGITDDFLRSSPPRMPFHTLTNFYPQPINFLSLLHPSSSPPYHVFVARIIKSSDQQASIFLQQKLKVADVEERHKIVDAICARGFEMMSHRFGNWAVQRCLEAAATAEERRKIVACMRGRVVDLATNCYGCHVLQKALDCEEDIRLLIVSELLLGDPALTLVNKHASHVWSKIMELTWTPPAPPIFSFVNKSLKGKWASLACHETGSLVVQHAFENLEESAKDGIIDELLNQGSAIFNEIAKNQWGSYCIQHILEHGSPNHRQMTLDHLVADLLDYATNEQGYKSVNKALKEGGKETFDKIVNRMCEPAKGGRRAMIVDLALSVTGSQLIASTLPQADKDQRTVLYECIRGHIVTLRGCKTGSKVIWLL